ncbi:MAG: hypothetical protein ABI652_05865, partial [Acidobacteriota bacterium]
RTLAWRRWVDASRRWVGAWRRWVDAHAVTLTAVLATAALVLRALLVIESPTPFGYVWDFYTDGVRVLYNQGRLPLAADCWQCAQPPLFYVLGLPFYALGRWLSPGPGDALALRFVGGLAMSCAGVTVYYGYRLLRLFRCRGASLVAGMALLLIFPCLFISSYAPESDIVLTAVMSAFGYYLARYVGRARGSGLGARGRGTAGSAFGARGSGTGAWWAWLRSDVVKIGVLAGLAAATKYSGLAAILSAGLVFTWLLARGPHRGRAVRDGLLVLVLCGAVGGWKYVDNHRRYNEWLQANGSSAQGFSVTASRSHGAPYEFTTMRLRELRTLMGPRPPAGSLTSFPVYQSVPTTLHALAWSDMSFFSVPSRHGDPSRPYPRKLIPIDVTMSVIVLGFVPEALAALGFVVTLRRRAFAPLAVLTVVSIAAYVWWFLPQASWALKTKYLLFLLPPFVLYAVVGLGWLNRQAPVVGLIASTLLVALVIVAHVYLYAFAVGRL